MPNRRSRSSTIQTLALVLLAIVLLRLAFDLVDVVCRARLWVLVRVCLWLEAAADWLADPRPLRRPPTVSASDAWDELVAAQRHPLSRA
jgi:hypothetical protein